MCSLYLILLAYALSIYEVNNCEENPFCIPTKVDTCRKLSCGGNFLVVRGSCFQVQRECESFGSN